MKILWSLVAILLGCLSLGGLLNAVNGGGLFDLFVSGALAWAAVGVWRGVRR